MVQCRRSVSLRCPAPILPNGTIPAFQARLDRETLLTHVNKFLLRMRACPFNRALPEVPVPVFPMILVNNFVDNNLWPVCGFVVRCSRSLKELRRLVANESLPRSFRDTPGRPGKGRVRLVDATPVKSVEIHTMEEAGFTSSSGGVRALSVNAKKELGGEERLETVPNRVK